METQRINEAVFLKLDPSKKYALHKGDQILLTGGYNSDRQFESYVEMIVDELIEGKEDEEEKESEMNEDLRPWVREAEGESCTL